MVFNHPNIMKLTIAFFGLLFTFMAASRASAQPYDSLAIGSIYYATTNYLANGVNNPSYMEGMPDGNSAHFVGGAEAIGMRFIAGDDSSVVMQKGDSLHIYLRIPRDSLLSVDSNVAFLELQRLDDNLHPKGDTTYYIKENIPADTEEMLTIIVPDTGFNAINVSVAAFDSGGNSFWLDAITLIQKGTAGVSEQLASREAVLASYPNPFEHSSRVAVHIDAPASGRGELLISDALGREVERVPIGELQPGGQDVSLAMNQAGIFFARLLIDGTPVGPPLKLVAE